MTTLDKETIEYLKEFYKARPLSFKTYVPMRDVLKEIEYALERRGSMAMTSVFRCPICGYTVNDIYEGGEVLLFEKGKGWNYCPNCGADLREEQGDDTV